MTSIENFFFYISMLVSEYNKNSFDVGWIKYEHMILSPLSSVSFWILYSNNRDILNTTTNLNMILNGMIYESNRIFSTDVMIRHWAQWISLTKFLFAFPLIYILQKIEGHNINCIFIIFLFETHRSTVGLHSIIRNSSFLAIRNRLFHFILNQERRADTLYSARN
jgi:hypothetical protein